MKKKTEERLILILATIVLAIGLCGSGADGSKVAIGCILIEIALSIPLIRMCIHYDRNYSCNNN